MASGLPDPAAPRGALSAAIRDTRRLRGLRTAEIAAMMHMDKRSYERFERCSAPARLDRLLTFARVTDSDPIGLLIAAVMDEPAIAVGGAGNKLSLVQAGALRRFTREVGGAVADLDTQTILAAASRMYDELADHLQRRRAMLQDLLGPGDAERPD